MTKNTYASLTAGLLARKGEAIPATASFEGEGITSAHQARRHLTSLPPASLYWEERAGPSSVPSGIVEDPPLPFAAASAPAEGPQPAQGSSPAAPGESPGESSGESGVNGVLPPGVEGFLLGREVSFTAPETAQSRSGEKPSEKADEGAPLPAALAEDVGPARAVPVNIRFDAARYLCLKMAAVKLGRSKQDILSAALDRYLESLADTELKECACLRQLIKGEM